MQVPWLITYFPELHSAAAPVETVKSFDVKRPGSGPAASAAPTPAAAAADGGHAIAQLAQVPSSRPAACHLPPNHPVPSSDPTFNVSLHVSSDPSLDVSLDRSLVQAQKDLLEQATCDGTLCSPAALLKRSGPVAALGADAPDAGTRWQYSAFQVSASPDTR